MLVQFVFLLFLFVVWPPGTAAADDAAPVGVQDRQVSAPQALLLQGEAALARGDRSSAGRFLDLALLAAEKENDNNAVGRAALGLSRLHLRSRQFLQAAKMLVRAEAAAAVSVSLAAAVAETRGRLAYLLDDREGAVRAYDLALAKAREAGDPLLAAGIELNRLRFFGEASAETRRSLHSIEKALQAQPSSLQRQRLQLELGRVALPWELELAHHELQGLIHDPAVSPRLVAQAMETLAEAYAGQKRHGEALILTQTALQRLGDQPAADLRLNLEWQQGRVLYALGRVDAAVAAYRRALAHLAAVRADLPMYDMQGHSVFQRLLDPLYRGLADLLLRQASLQDNREAQQLRHEARELIENYRAAELQDYFKSACAVSRRRLTRLDANIAVLYPIVLPDRIEILLGLEDQLYQASVATPDGSLGEMVREIAGSFRIRDGRPQRFPQEGAARLHRWLLAPFIDRLQAAGVDTLIYVPDGILRTLPLAALWDGEKYVAERFAVVTAPGLSLVDAGVMAQGKYRALLAGLSRPGPVVAELPDWMIGDYVSLLRGGGTLAGYRGRSVQVQSAASSQGEGPSKEKALSVPGIAKDQETLEALQEVLRLPGVAQEIEALAKDLPNTRMENESFRLAAVTEALKDPYRIVHLASHGVFTGDPEQSFILTYDHLLDMRQLSDLFQSEAFDETPVELLTLSACQTAAGDDRSPLGLTGVAIQSGARSALGALWPVSDGATQQLLAAFYRALLQPGGSKAQALRQAQLSLMTDKQYRHPFFWAAFILVGNWR